MDGLKKKKLRFFNNNYSIKNTETKKDYASLGEFSQDPLVEEGAM